MKKDRQHRRGNKMVSLIGEWPIRKDPEVFKFEKAQGVKLTYRRNQSAKILISQWLKRHPYYHSDEDTFFSHQGRKLYVFKINVDGLGSDLQIVTICSLDLQGNLREKELRPEYGPAGENRPLIFLPNK